MLIHLLVDLALQNIILTKMQVDNDTDGFYNEAQKARLLGNAMQCSASLLFCSKYLFRSLCRIKLFNFDVERDRF